MSSPSFATRSTGCGFAPGKNSVFGSGGDTIREHPSLDAWANATERSSVQSPHFDWFPLALDGDRAEGGPASLVAECLPGRPADDDLTGLGSRHEARGGVRGVADDREAAALRGADVAKHRPARVDADAERRPARTARGD